MASRRTLKLSFVVCIAAAAPIAFANSAGPTPGYTGAPGELTCRSCHTSFPLNDGAGELAIEGAPATYEPGASYTLTVRLARPDRTRWGFQLVALTDALEQAGSFSLVETSRTQLKTDDGKTYVEHRTAGTAAGTTGGSSWRVEWHAPEAGAGTVTFYAAGNAANGNGQPTGDNIYTAFAESFAAVSSPPFENVTAAVGLASAPGGEGVAWADVDRDGDDDLYIAGEAGGALMRNDDGRFVDASAALGLEGVAARAAAWGDADGDGRPDLFVAGAGGARLYRNAGASFEAAEPLPVAGPAAAGAWGDYDGDGRLDLFVGLDARSVLLRNGDAGWEDATAAAGLESVGAARAIAWGDYDGDGRLDLLVTTAASVRLFRQTAERTFEEAAGIASPAAPREATWLDYDADGRIDVAIAADGGIRLLRNRGDGAFDDATVAAGLGGVVGRQIAAGDADGDGRLDLLVASGSGVRLLRYDGAAFADATSGSGVAPVDGDAGVWADADGDGHVDLLVLSAAGVEIWRNPSTSPTASARALTDADNDATDATTGDDRDATGATIVLDADDGTIQTRIVSGGGSSAQPPAHAFFATRFATSGRLRATFADGEGREAGVTTGDGVEATLRDPRAARVDAVSVKVKSGGSKLLVDGARFVTEGEVVEVDGRAMATTKYPKKRRESDGTSTRLAGKDPSFDAVVPRGRAVLVTTYDPATGVRSAPVRFTR